MPPHANRVARWQPAINLKSTPLGLSMIDLFMAFLSYVKLLAHRLAQGAQAARGDAASIQPGGEVADLTVAGARLGGRDRQRPIALLEQRPHRAADPFGEIERAQQQGRGLIDRAVD